MSSLFDPVTIVFLVVAVVLFLRLRSTLGSRTGDERPPTDPYSRESDTSTQNDDNVVTLPGANSRNHGHMDEGDRLFQEHNPDPVHEDPEIAATLKQIAADDPDFSLEEFISGAQIAYEMIVTGFAEGNREQLGSLLGKEVFDSFTAAIDDRSSRSETVELAFVGINSAEICSASHENGTAQIGMRFVSQLSSCTKDAENRIIEGDPNTIIEAIDLWTFSRNLNQDDPNWMLVATESGE